MRMLRRKGTEAPVYPWHQYLALRQDFEEFDDGTPEVNVTKAFVEHLEREKSEGIEVQLLPPSVGEDVDVTTITDKDQLKAMLADRGIKLPGTPTVATLQARLADAIKGT